MEGGHGIGSEEAHQTPGEAAEYPDASELFSCQQRQLIRDTTVPRSVASIKVFHTPRLFASAQPAVLLTALAWDARVGEPQLPVALPTHLHLPVLAALAEALLADYI